LLDDWWIKLEEFVRSIELALAADNWHAALVVALALPDMAGFVEDPSAASGTRYSEWFDSYVGDRYKSSWHTFLSGSDCYALRCSLLHEGRDETAHQRARDALDRFQFLAPMGWNIHCNQAGTKLQLQVDIFCRDICHGVRSWLMSIPASDVRQTRLSAMLQIQTSGPIQI
jgi:hypothetical protein